MKKLLPFCIFTSFLNISHAQVTQVTVWPGKSGNIITGLFSYSVTEAIYLSSEIGSGNFLTAGTAIDRVGFNLSIPTTVTSFPGFNVYIKEVAAATSDIVNGIYSTTGYTLVYSGTLTANNVGWTYLDLTTPFVRTLGTNNLQVMVERTIAASAAGIQWNASIGNSNDVAPNQSHFTARRTSPDLKPPVSDSSILAATSFRPQLYLSHKNANDVSVEKFDALPPNSCHSNIQNAAITIKNLGTSPINAGDAVATLTLSNANTGSFNATNITSIAPGGTEQLTFSGINVNNIGTNNYSANINLAGDVYTQDNLIATTGATLPVINSYPSIENMEAVGYNSFKSFFTVSGPRQLWGLRSTAYTNANQTQPLNAHAGSKFLLFDAFLAPSSLGTSGRYYSDCFSLPVGGCPSVSFWMSHDNTTTKTQKDSMYVVVSTDKGATWVKQNILGIGAGLQRHDGSLVGNNAPIWRKNTVDLSAYIGQTIQIGFEGVSKYGNAFGLDDIEVANTPVSNVALQTLPSVYVLTQGCDDMGWTYYTDGVGKNVLAVEWGTNTATKNAAAAYLNLDASNYSATAGSGASATGTFTMKRYWNIDVAGVQPTTPVNLRFFYDATEKNIVDAAAASFQTANPGSMLETPTWFKTNSGVFIGDAAHVNDAGVLNATSFADANTAAATINGVLYAQFNGINSFSGGSYASGVGSGSVLPVSIELFTGSKQNYHHFLEWKINCTTEPSITIILERSNDGKNFTALQQQNATATRCLASFNFVDNQLLNGANYYRLKTITVNGKINFSPIVLLMNKKEGLQIVSISPNPVKNNTVLTINNAKAQKIKVTVTDLAGKIVFTNIFATKADHNLINLNFTALSAGTYFLTVSTADAEQETTKFVKY